MSLPIVHLDNATLESGNARPEQINGPSFGARKIMNGKSARRFQSPVDCVNNGALMLQQLQTISEQLVVSSEQSPSDLISTTAMDQVNYCRVCLDRAHTTKKCPHISNL